MGHVFSIRYCGLNCNKTINLSSAFHLISGEQEQCTMPYVIPTEKITPRQTAHDARSSKISFRNIINLPFQYVVEERLHVFRISKISPSSTETHSARQRHMLTSRGLALQRLPYTSPP